jgi:hypothetical protein
MMLEVVPAVRRLLPGLLNHARPTVACVCTTRPKYLVFDADAAQPACIVEFGESARLLRTDRILSELSSRLPHRVAAPLACAAWRGGTYVHVQEGLQGVPWFRVGDRIATDAEWRSLLDGAVRTMIALHAATRDVPAWTGSVHAGAALRREADACERHGCVLAPSVHVRVREWSATIDSGGVHPAFWQHGDFSLNNVLVDGASIAIIDFDEFGGTLVPLHDAFGLALSVGLSQASCPLSLRDCIRLAVAHATIDEAVDPAHLPGLLMHHLLWRLNQCHGLDRRTSLAGALLRWAHELAHDPRQFLDFDKW